MSQNTGNTGYIVYQLKALMHEGVVSSLFTDPENPDDFIAGYLRMVNSRQSIVQALSPYGQYDGWFALRNSCVNEALYDAVYADRLETLLKLNHASDVVMPMPGQEDDYMRHMLSWAMEHHRVVTVWTREDAFTGFVTELDDLRLTIGVLDFMGQNPLATQFALRDLELMSSGSEEERMYEKLNEHFEKEEGK